jgi:hypothetical protein
MRLAILTATLLLSACQTAPPPPPMQRSVAFAADPGDIVVTTDSGAAGACQAIGRLRVWATGPDLRNNALREIRGWATKRGANLVVADGLYELIPGSYAIMSSKVYKC